MLSTQPWKLAAIGAMTVVGGVALLSAGWSTEQLAACLAIFFAARGTVHWVASPGWVGLSGAMVALLGGGELAVGLVLVAWPDPSQRVVPVVAGVWLLVYGIVATTIAVTTRAEEPRWRLPVAAAVINTAFGVALLVERGGTIKSTAIVLGLLAVVQGVFEIVVAVSRGRAARHGAFRAARTRASASSIGHNVPTSLRGGADQ
jgi:uncharacterized membrane protein HdeD (DUF308 family)